MQSAKHTAPSQEQGAPFKNDFESDDEIMDEAVTCLLSDRASRSLELCNLLKDKIFEDPKWVNIKIRTFKKLGNFARAHEFIRECQPIEKSKEWEKVLDSGSNDQKSHYLEFLQNKAWEKAINHGRFELMKEAQEKIQEIFGEESEQMAYNHFFTGWLLVGDKDYEKANEKFLAAIELYEKIHESETHLQIAECYRYLAQSYYHQNKDDLAEETYQKERRVREQLQGTNCGDYAVVLNSLANVIGCKKKNYEAGMAYIQEALGIYENTIGYKNQNYMIALDWQGWYLNSLQRYDEAVLVWERSILLAYQVFGGQYYIYKNLRDSNLWNLYMGHFDILERIQLKYYEKAQEQMEFGELQEAEDLVYVGLDLLKKVNTIYQFNKKQYTQEQLDAIQSQLTVLQEQISEQKVKGAENQ